MMRSMILTATVLKETDQRQYTMQDPIKQGISCKMFSLGFSFLFNILNFYSLGIKSKKYSLNTCAKVGKKAVHYIT